MEYGGPSSSYGYSSQGAGRSSIGRAGVGPSSQQASMPGRAEQSYGYAPTSQQQQAYGASSASASSAARDRSSQINDYVAKQKAAKQNAPLIRKENQRLAEARVASASRSKVSDAHDDYTDDYSHAGGYDEPPLPAQQARAAASAAARPRPVVQAQNTGYSAPPPQQMDRRSVGPQPVRSAAAPKSVSYDDGYGAAPSAGSSAPGGGGGGGGTNAELLKRVAMLEDQIRLLKQQNRIFLSFMQNTEQQLAEVRSQPPTPAMERSRSRNGYDAPPAQAATPAYATNMSQGTKQVLQRSQSERQTQGGPPGSARAGGPPAQQSPSLGALGGRNDVDQSFAPLDPDDEARRERMRSAKKKAPLANLRNKMKGGVGAGADEQQQDSRGRGYQADAYQDEYGGGGGGGYGAPPQQQSAPRSAAPQRAAVSSASSRRPTASPPPPSEDPEDDYSSAGPNDSFSGGGGSGGIPPGADEVVETFPCPNCERRFNAQALQKHVAKQICKQKPRKVFDMAAQRLEDLAKEAREAGIQLLPKKGSAPAAAAAAKKDALPVKKQSKWRADHEKFMAAIQAGRQMQAAVDAGIPLSSLPPPVTREEDDDRTPCPHCGRKFESGVADRHIPHCKNTKNKPKSTVASAARLGSTARRR